MVVILASLFLPFTPQFEIKSNLGDTEALIDSNIIKDSSLPPNSALNNASHTNPGEFSYSNVNSGAITPEVEEQSPLLLVNSPIITNPNTKRNYTRARSNTNSFYKEAGVTEGDAVEGVFDPNVASKKHQQLSKEEVFKSNSMITPQDIINEKIQNGDISGLKKERDADALIDSSKIGNSAIIVNPDEHEALKDNNVEDSDAFMNNLTAGASGFNMSNVNQHVPNTIDSVASQVNIESLARKHHPHNQTPNLRKPNEPVFSDLLKHNLGSSANLDSDYNSMASSMNSSASNLNSLLMEPQARHLNNSRLQGAHDLSSPLHASTNGLNQNHSLLKQVSNVLMNNKPAGTIITPKSRELPSEEKNVDVSRDLKAGLSSTTSMRRIHRKSSGAGPNPGMETISRSNSQTQPHSNFKSQLFEIDDVLEHAIQDEPTLYQPNTDPSVDSMYPARNLHVDGTFSDDGVGSDNDSKRVERASFEFNQQEVPKFGGYSNAEFLKNNLLNGQQNIFSKADWSIVPSHKCNTGLKNAVNTAIFEKTFNQPVIFYGTLGVPTDVLPENVLNNVTGTLKDEFNCEAVISDDITFKGAYKNFCKEILWPTFHYQIPDNPKSKAFEDHSWNHYKALNQKFADKIIENYSEDDTVWVHDYHLLLVPGMVREKLPDAKIGFSLHISFPSSEVFRCFAQRDFILKGLLGANSLGFQTEEYAKHFALTCNRLMQTDGDIEDGIKFAGRTIHICTIPIGIDAFEIQRKLRNAEDFDFFKNIIKDRWASNENKRLIVSKDQFDSLRGLKTKFMAYEKFLRDNPSYISRVCFVQVVTGSTKKDKYLEKEIVGLVDRINNLSTDITVHQNIVLLTQDITEIQYYALLSEADIFWVNSMREGMNLACHDFIVANSDKNSPLMISEFTGSAELFKEGCLLTNPWDIKRLSEIVKFALEMSPEEKRRRWKKMMKKLTITDSDNWIISSVKSINSSWELNIERSTLFNLQNEEWEESYNNCKGKNKLFVFKISEPPTPEIIKTMNDLCSVPGNKVFILNSFDKATVERYYARVANLNLIAENGAFVRIDGVWYTLMGDNLWKNEVLPLLQDKLERLPGSYIKAGESMFRIHTENADDKDRVNDIVGDLILHINTLFGSRKGIHAYYHKSILFVQQFGLSLRALKFIFDYYASSGSSSMHRNSSATSLFNLNSNSNGYADNGINMSRGPSMHSPLLKPLMSPITPSTPSKVQLQLKSVNSISDLQGDDNLNNDDNSSIRSSVDGSNGDYFNNKNNISLLGSANIRPHLNTFQSFEQLNLLNNNSSCGENLKGVNKFSFAMITGSSSPTIEPLFEYINRFKGANIAYTYTCVYGDPTSTNAHQHVNGMNDLIKLLSANEEDSD